MWCIHVFTSGFHRDEMCLHCSGCHVVHVPWFSLIFYISAHMALLGFEIAVCCFLSPHWWCLDEVIIGKTFTTCLSAALWLPGFAYSLRSGAQDIAACILLVKVSVSKENDVLIWITTHEMKIRCLTVIYTSTSYISTSPPARMQPGTCN